MRLYEVTPATNTGAVVALINRDMAHHPPEPKVRVNSAAMGEDFDEFLVFGRSAEGATKSLTAIAQIHNAKAAPIVEVQNRFNVVRGIFEDNPTPPGTYAALSGL